MKIETPFDIGQIVYHRLDNQKGMICEIKITPAGELFYSVSWGHDHWCWCSAIQLSTEPSPEWAEPVE